MEATDRTPLLLLGAGVPQPAVVVVAKPSTMTKQMQYGCMSVDMPKQLDGSDTYDYRPLTHQQIAKYANDPWWQNLRRGLMISFWASMALMVVAAVLIAVVQHEHVCIAGKSIRPMIVAPGGGDIVGPNVVLLSGGSSSNSSGSGSGSGNGSNSSGGNVLAIVSSESSASVRDLRGTALGIDWLRPI